MEQEQQCKYYLHGACSKGANCRFLHDLNAKKSNICKFYLSGACSYGSNCRYDHVKAARIMKPVVDNKKIERISNLTVLGKKGETKDVTENNNWIDAPVFVPGKKSHLKNPEQNTPALNFSPHLSYSSVTLINLDDYHTSSVEDEENLHSFQGDIHHLLCPFAAVRECPYGESCEYLHGETCDMCGLQCLHPTNKQQREEHRVECVEYHENEMERAFAAQRSNVIVCSICLDVVKEKADITERLFGLLENCSHAFCLCCIRNWRSSCQQEKTVVRACPICRVVSWYVTPSEFWITDESEKRTVIDRYKAYLSTKPCRNFDQGRGECPFGASCFYRHAYPDGSVDESKPNLRYREGSDGSSDAIKTPRLNEFIAARDS